MKGLKGLADVRAGDKSAMPNRIAGLKEQIGTSQGLHDIKTQKPEGAESQIDKRTKNWFK
jgi:hypothetical protein